MTCGVYQILNRENGKRYIGGSLEIKKRWRGHRSDLKRGLHVNKPLQQDWNRYGSEAFVFMVLEECSAENLLDREQRHLPPEKTIEALENGGYYNICPIAGNTTGLKPSEKERKRVGGINRDRKLSEETRRKISEAKKGVKQSAENVKKRADAIRGRPVSEETRRKIREANTGKKHTIESRRKIGESVRKAKATR